MGVPFLVGKYRDFDTKWYFDVGAKITLAMISNSIIGPFASKAFQPFMIIFLNRWFLDRCKKRHLRKLHNVLEEQAAEEEERHDKAAKGENNPEGDGEEGEGGSRIEEGGSKIDQIIEEVMKEGGEDNSDTHRQLTSSKYQEQSYYDEGGQDQDQDGSPPKGPSPFGDPNAPGGATGTDFRLEDDDCETQKYF